MASEIKNRHPCQKQTYVKPTSHEEWDYDLTICETILTLAEDGHSIHNRGYYFYVPPTIRHLLSLHKPGHELFGVVTLMKDLYLSRIIEQNLMFEGQLSDLDAEEDIVDTLTKHIRIIVQVGTTGTACVEEMVLSLVRGLIKDMDDLQQPGLRLEPPSGDAVLDARDATAASNVYFLACALHPEIDIDGSQADWYKDLFHRQPIFIDDHKQHCRRGMLDAAERLPALTYLLRQSMTSAGDDFERVFEVFGRWALTVVYDLTTSDDNIPSCSHPRHMIHKDG